MGDDGWCSWHGRTAIEGRHRHEARDFGASIRLHPTAEVTQGTPGILASKLHGFEITRRLRDVGELVGVRVLDHIVIGKGCRLTI
jgi:hypothetical protein